MSLKSVLEVSWELHFHSAENSNDSSSRSSQSQSASIVRSKALNFIRPSVLGSNLGSTAIAEDDKSEDTLAANPFVREDSALNTSGAAVGISNDVDSKPEEVDDKIDPLILLNKNGLPKSNLFAQVAKAGSGSGFVFGQNVYERVVGVSKCLEMVFMELFLLEFFFRTI